MYIPLSIAACLAGQALSQSTFQNDMSTDTSRSSPAAALMNITFSEPSPNCDTSTSSSSRLSIAIRTIPQDQVCFNLGNTFSNPEDTYWRGDNKCERNTICGVNYTITASEFRDGANYSEVRYTQIRNPFAAENQDQEQDEGRERVGGRLEFQVYNGANCKKRDGVESRVWSCLSEAGECDAVPFSVQSFSVAMTDPEEVGSGNCSVAKTGGAGRCLAGGGGVARSLVGAAVAVVGAMVLL